MSFLGRPQTSRGAVTGVNPVTSIDTVLQPVVGRKALSRVGRGLGEGCGVIDWSGTSSPLTPTLSPLGRGR